MRPRRIIRERPPAKHNGEPPAEFVELAPGELSGVFTAPSWLRDLGMMSWLLVGVAALAVGVAVLLSLTNAIVAPVVTAAIVAAVLSPLVRKLHARGLPRAGGRRARVPRRSSRSAVLFAVLMLGAVTSQSAELVELAQERRRPSSRPRSRTPASAPTRPSRPTTASAPTSAGRSTRC